MMFGLSTSVIKFIEIYPRKTLEEQIRPLKSVRNADESYSLRREGYEERVRMMEERLMFLELRGSWVLDGLGSQIYGNVPGSECKSEQPSIYKIYLS